MLDIALMVSGWLAFIGLAIYVLSRGQITWKMFRAFLEQMSEDKEVLAKMKDAYVTHIRPTAPTFLRGLIDEWFTGKGFEIETEEAVDEISEEDEKEKKKAKKDKKNAKKKTERM